MFLLARNKGEKIIIEGCAQIRVAHVQENRVRLDVISPHSRALRREQLEDGELDGFAILEIREIRRRSSDSFRVSIGIQVPVGATVRRAEVSQQLTPVSQRFPWHRYRPTARYWRQLSEAIAIPIPKDV